MARGGRLGRPGALTLLNLALGLGGGQACRLDANGSGPDDDAARDTVAEGLDGCSNGILDPGESDSDCGGPCARCSDGRRCRRDEDCLGRCRAGLCTSDRCGNGVKDADESDIDCGGMACSKCTLGKKCAGAMDCSEGDCLKGRCALPTCTDGVLNGKETDVDCGGLCSPCKLEKQCATAADCESMYCDVSFCRTPPHCGVLRGLVGSGVYKIDPDGAGGVGAPFDAYCEMSLDGGGWTYFSHVGQTASGAPFFASAIGTYAPSRDGTSTYSLGSRLLGVIVHKEMVVLLDSPDPTVALAAKKALFFRYTAGHLAFNVGPIPCSGLDGFSYRTTASASFVDGGTSSACSAGQWYSRTAGNTAYLTGFDLGPYGNFWGVGMGGDDTWKHDGYWFVR